MAAATADPLVIVVTGTDSGFGYLTARSLALQGHIVYSGLLPPESANANSYAACRSFSSSNNCRLIPVHLNVTSDASVASAVPHIIQDQGRIDVVVHNAGHMSWGPAEAFTPEQFLSQYDTNCVGCHRLNRAVLPHMRARRSGLLVWVTSGSAHGPSSPFLAPYFAAKAAQDSLAQTTALEVGRWGVESSIVVPGIFTRGTNHFPSAEKPADTQRDAEYGQGSPMEGWSERCMEGSGRLASQDADPQLVADAVVTVVGMKQGSRPWRVHVEPDDGGAEAVNAVRDWARRRYVTRMGCEPLLETNHG